MALVDSYAVWNNKGGVGKSTVTFHLATRYAERFPHGKVLVVDMCPQANVSMMLLGGGTSGENHVLQLCQHAPTPKTVVGYLATVLTNGPAAALPPQGAFLEQPSTVNGEIPQNLFLLAGDGNLEPMAPLISDRASQAALLPGTNPWLWVHQLIRKFISAVCESGTEDWMVFVDTNPSFSIYTEVAVSAVHRLIVPVNADDASRVATNAMFTLIWGANPPHPIYGQYTYASKAAAANLDRPVVHLVVGNRLTQHLGPATAFGAISDATADTLYDAFKAEPARFSSPATAVQSLQDFRDAFSVPLRDFNTAGVVAAHLGIPLSRLNERTYQVYGRDVRVDARRTSECSDAVDDVLNRI